MDQAEEALPTSSRRVIDLAPFDFFRTRRSALGGLGGVDGVSDPNYAFHTHYQACAPGPITFTLRLHDLEAADGYLMLRINTAPADFRADVKLARTAQVPLASLRAHGGEVSLQVKARRGMVYAFLGHVFSEDSIAVSGVTITLDRFDHSDTDADTVAETEESEFGAEAARPINLLIADREPSLARPVSQVETVDQRRNRDFKRWARELGDGEADWPTVFVARALEAYGMLEPGARGAQLGDVDTRLAAALSRAGCEVDRLDASVAADANGAGGEYDFAWSVGAAGRFGSAAEARGWIENTIDLLKVGGMAVHCFRFRPGSTGGGEPGALILTRSDVERLAFGLIANNHETAQIAYGPFARGPVFPELWFGLIVRRGSF